IRDFHVTGVQTCALPISIDRGLTAARKFIFKALGDELNLRGRPTPVDPKSRLQELVQARWQRAPTYRTVHEEGPEHRKVFTVEEVGRASCRERAWEGSGG